MVKRSSADAAKMVVFASALLMCLSSVFGLRPVGLPRSTAPLTPPSASAAHLMPHATSGMANRISHAWARPQRRGGHGQQNIQLWQSSAAANIDEQNDDSTSSAAASAATEVITKSTSKPPLPLVLWRFTRPHTIIGSALAIPALHVLAAPTFRDAFRVKTGISILFALVPSLLMNLYITGLNQLYDVEIDKINKPDLPLACGDLSMRGGIIAVTVSLIVSLAMGASNSVLGSQGLNMALWFSAILGTMYSAPPFRLKRFPLLAAFCIVAVRGAVINAGFFAHATLAAYGSSTSVLHCLTTDARCILSSLYFAVFGVVIALMKDVPDAKGDRMFNVRTFSVRLGQKRVYKMMHRLLSTLFAGVGASFLGGAALPGVSSTLRVCRSIVGASSIAASVSVQKEAAPVDAENPKEVYGFYMHLWKLFFLSYIVLPLAR